MNSIMCFALLLTVTSVLIHECCKTRNRTPRKTIEEILQNDGNESDDESDTEDKDEDTKESHDTAFTNMLRRFKRNHPDLPLPRFPKPTKAARGPSSDWGGEDTDDDKTS